MVATREWPRHHPDLVVAGLRSRMARMFPPGTVRFVGGEGEAEVFAALKQLPDRVAVVYSLRWLNPGRDRDLPVQGEGDFVVFDPEQGILCIEVKGGTIRFENGQCIQTNRRTRQSTTEHPAEQASDMAHRIKKALRFSPTARGCLVRHAVWFPTGDLLQDAPLPFDYPAATTLQHRDLADGAAAVNGAFAYWRSAGNPPHKLLEGGAEEVLAVLLPKLDIVPTPGSRRADREAALVQMTQEQSRVLDFLDEQDRAVVAGAAGTGKTLVALEQARRLAGRGDGTVVMLCYHKALRNHLRANHPIAGVEFHTVHSLAGQYVDGAVERLPALLVAYLAADRPIRFRHLIVDEGQDFENDWLDWLALRTAGACYVFYDRNQLVRLDELPDWLSQADCRLLLRRNCRNSTAIAKFSTRPFSASLKHPLPVVLPPDADGPRPRLHLAGSDDEARRIADRLAGGMTASNGLRPDEVAVLTVDDAPPAFARLGDHAVADEPTAAAVTLTTVRRFKGLEASAVVLLGVDARRFNEPEYLRLLYVGASRAKHYLHVILAPSDADAIAAGVIALDPSPQRRRSPATLAKLLFATIAENTDDPLAE